MKVMYFPTFTPLKYPQIQQYGLKVLNTKDDFKPYSDQMCDTQKNHAKLESYFWHFLTIYVMNIFGTLNSSIVYWLFQLDDSKSLH